MTSPATNGSPPAKDSETFVRLYPVRVPRTSRLFPFPGASHASALAAREVLDHNHKTFHCFFNQKSFHNHLPHHVLAALALGATPDFFPRIYQSALKDLDPTFELNKKPTVGGPIEEITDKNWKAHVGDKYYYWSYLTFFEQQIRQHGASATLERFVFSPEANSEKECMLARMIGGAVHPFIHIGYGVEFAVDALVAEGLAMATATEARWKSVFPLGWHSKVGPSDVESATLNALATGENIATALAGKVATILPRAAEQAITSATDKLANIAFAPDTSLSPSLGGAVPLEGTQADINANLYPKPGQPSASHPRAGLSIFSLLAIAGEDPALAPGASVKHSTNNKLDAAIDNLDSKLVDEYFVKWITTADDVRDPDPITGLGGWVTKFEELAWFNTLTVGATSRPGKSPRHDFFLMHGLTSLIFLPPMLPALSHKSRSQLLHAHMRVAFTYWVARGRPPFFIRNTLNASSENPRAPHHDAEKIPAVGEKGVAPPSATNGWYEILQFALHHDDEHTTKAIRSLSYLATLFAGTPPGAITIQPEAEKAVNSGSAAEGIWRDLPELDGTAFIRTAGQILATQGWQSSGNFNWDFNGPGFDETWQDSQAGQQPDRK